MYTPKYQEEYDREWDREYARAAAREAMEAEKNKRKQVKHSRNALFQVIMVGIGLIIGYMILGRLFE